MRRTVAAGAALLVLAGCGAPTTEVAAVEKIKARRVVEEAETFHEETQQAIARAEAAVRAAEEEIARQVAAAKAEATREAAQRAAAARASRSDTTARPVVSGDVWDRLAACESGGNWSINTGNGYFGGLQMDMSFWRSYGGPEHAPRPDLASREAQIVVATRARDGGRGYHPWPTCARRLGLI